MKRAKVQRIDIDPPLTLEDPPTGREVVNTSTYQEYYKARIEFEMAYFLWMDPKTDGNRAAENAHFRRLCRALNRTLLTRKLWRQERKHAWGERY